VSDENAKVATTCNTEITSSWATDFSTVSMGCNMSHFINCIAMETSAARSDRAEHACLT
jgi:hypothetical protein